MNEFYDRFNELNKLKDKYDGLKKGELCILYGRRRVGKTELVLKFMNYVKSKKIYFYVNKLTKKSLMVQFSNDIKNQTKDDIKITGSWDSFFDYLVEESEKDKLVLVIDEFQRISDVSEDFITMLQHKWDASLRNRKIMIILLGSSMGMTHDLVFSSKGPLYGRNTLNLKIRPFRYIDFREMFHHLNNEEQRINYYAVFGGTAHYLALAKASEKQLFDAVKEVILTEGSPLYDEPTTLLASELKSYGRHNAILISIAQGKKGLNDFVNILGIEPNKITYYLDHLTNKLDLIRKTEPLFGKKKKTRYELHDNFFKFWYRFVFTSKSALEMKNINVVLNKIREQFEGYVSSVFEEICKELLILYNGEKLKENLINFEKIGSWWESGEEIDIVAYSKRELILGEVKWRNKPQNGLTLLNNLERKSRNIEFSGRMKYIIFSKEGFSEDTRNILENRNVICLDLKDMEMLFNDIAKKESSKQKTLSPYFA